MQDILGKRSIATVWVPDYCCSSVIYPFTDLGCTDIAFYHVGLSPHGFSLELSDFCPRRGDVIYYCDYYWFDARLYEAILAKDYPVVMGVTIVVAAIVVGMNFLADVLNAVVSPRIRTGN